jgi:hypothetical protein
MKTLKQRLAAQLKDLDARISRKTSLGPPCAGDGRECSERDTNFRTQGFVTGSQNQALP